MSLSLKLGGGIWIKKLKLWMFASVIHFKTSPLCPSRVPDLKLNQVLISPFVLGQIKRVHTSETKQSHGLLRLVTDANRSKSLGDKAIRQSRCRRGVLDQQALFMDQSGSCGLYPFGSGKVIFTKRLEEDFKLGDRCPSLS